MGSLLETAEGAQKPCGKPKESGDSPECIRAEEAPEAVGVELSLERAAAEVNGRQADRQCEQVKR
jgi:hypothetical protein